MSAKDASAFAIHVHTLRAEAPIAFAAQELARYLTILSGRDVQTAAADSYKEGAAIYLGLLADFPHMPGLNVSDPRFDDAIAIEITGDTGIIAGNNPRSVLLAVYRYLTELGCQWVRPGADGEILPQLDALPDISLADTPSYRHRAVCIEGAVSTQHVQDMIDWLPKLGFNGYFIQFREAYTFFDRWYSHIGHPQGTPRSLPVEDARSYVAQAEAEIAKRGLIYHKVGHGWTCEPFGISGLDWEKEETEPGPEITQYFAQVDGERKLWHGVALNTNLCYSRPDVRSAMVDAIAQYAKTNPDVDLLHVWLADGSNNNCECPGCAKARPADFYVDLLNELDDRLTQDKLDTKIVFLIYVDLLWPPERAQLINPRRFVLMFAPIVRTYSQTFSIQDDLPELPPFNRNHLDFPASVDANVAFLDAWQQIFHGDSFDFDYHLMWDHTNDPGHTAIADTIAQDMRGLRTIGLNGFVSCQIQRIFLPTGLAMTAMGRTLWDRSITFDQIATEYFTAAFGPDAPHCREYLTRLSEHFDPPYMRGERETVSPEAAARLAAIPGLVQSFIPIIERNLDAQSPAQAQSWRYLEHHAELMAAFANALAARAQGDKTTARQRWEQVKTMAWDKEHELHPVFDTWLFTSRNEGRFS